MRDVLQNSGVTQSIEFRNSEGALPADVGSVSYSLYGHTGSLIRGPVSIQTPPMATTASITFLAADNVISTPRRFEKRRLIVDITSGDQSYSFSRTWRVIPLLNYWTTEDDVRALLGLSSDEILNEEIDLFSAYMTLENELTQSVLTAAFSAGTVLETSANHLLAVEAALAAIPSLSLRTPMVQADGSKRFERFRTAPDWGRIATDLAGARADLIAEISGVASAAENSPLAVFATPTDSITG